LYILLAIPAAAADTGPIVAVTGGQVQNATLERGGAVFKGIPFAQPPVGYPVVEISPAQARRQFTMARAWLGAALFW
jgi:hypothetical protein